MEANRFRPGSRLSKLDKGCKVVVVGSGITGLAAGALLAEVGCEVQVLEAHPTLIGGHARSFEIEGFLFCAGPQYVWHFGPGQIGRRALELLGLAEEVPFDPMDPDGFERIVVGGESPVDIPMGFGRMREAILRRIPSEAASLGRFFGDLERLSKAAAVIFERALYLEAGRTMKLGVGLSPAVSVGEKLSAIRFASASAGDLFARSGLSPLARLLAYGHGGIFAESAAQVSAALYAAATGLYHQGAAYPRHGFRSLIEGLARAIERRGGSVERGKRVVRLELEGNRVRRVHCADGSRYAADIVVSNLSPRITCGLLDGASERPFAYAPSNTLVSCFLGVRNYPGLAAHLERKNLWWYATTDDVDYARQDMTAPPQMLYLGSPSLNAAVASGGRGADRGEGDHSIIAFAPGNFDQAVQARARGEACHEDLRARMGERVLEVLCDRLFPGLRDHVRVMRVLTPLDLHAEIGCEAGNVYGRRLTARSLLEGCGKMPRIPNLHVACATVGVPGIASGLRTAARLVERLAGVKV